MFQLGHGVAFRPCRPDCWCAVPATSVETLQGRAVPRLRHGSAVPPRLSAQIGPTASFAGDDGPDPFGSTRTFQHVCSSEELPGDCRIIAQLHLSVTLGAGIYCCCWGSSPSADSDAGSSSVPVVSSCCIWSVIHALRRLRYSRS